MGILVIGLIYLQLSVSAQSLPPSVVINEYLSDPAGTDTGLEWIELFNPTCNTIDMTGYELTASTGNFYVIPNFVLSSRSFVTVHWRKDGINTQTDLFTTAVTITSNIGNTSGYVALFNSSTHSKNTIIDYLEYGISTQSWEQIASDAGVWQKGDYFAISGEGKTNGRINDGVDTNTSTDWKVYETSSMGDGNSVSINPCVAESPSSTPSQTIIPTITPTSIPSPTISNTPTVSPSPTIEITPTSFPTVTLTLIPTPTVIPTSLPTIKPTVTPTFTPQIEYIIPTDLKSNDNISIKVLITNAKPQTEYAIKFEAGLNNTWIYGKTVGIEGNFLAWNGSWKSFPNVITNNVGLAEKLITSQIININGIVDTRIKIYDLVSDKYYYSGVKSLDVLMIVPSVTPTPAVQLTSTPTPTNISPKIELKTIKEMKLMSEKTIVKVQGWVSVEQNLLGNNSLYIQDESAGIKITLPELSTTSIVKGDNLIIIGELGFPYNEGTIDVKSESGISVEKTDHIFQLQKVSTGSVGENIEGNLVGLIGKVVETSGNTFFIDDGSGRVKIYIKDSTQINKPYMRQGYYVSVIGIVSQYKEEYRVLPRYNSDLYVSKSPISENVLGVIDELPDTGNWNLVTSLIFFVVGILGLFMSSLAQRFMLRDKKCVV